MEAQSRLGSVNRRKLIIKRPSGSCRFEFASGSPKSRFVSIALRDLARRGFGTKVIRYVCFTSTPAVRFAQVAAITDGVAMVKPTVPRHRGSTAGSHHLVAGPIGFMPLSRMAAAAGYVNSVTSLMCHAFHEKSRETYGHRALWRKYGFERVERSRDVGCALLRARTVAPQWIVGSRDI
jgi:hypothetical protein